jgi:hypothetical protein
MMVSLRLFSGPPLEDWEATIWPRMVEALFIHKNLEQQDLGLLEVSERLAKTS